MPLLIHHSRASAYAYEEEDRRWLELQRRTSFMSPALTHSGIHERDCIPLRTKCRTCGAPSQTVGYNCHYCKETVHDH
jgi:hypothetical protein